jgi:DNA polymerase III sliding clamp (beta) subunit (PCNA family)
MKITAKAGDLAEALALAELALTAIDPQAKKITALSAVHIQVADGIIMLTANILDFCITVKTQAEILEPGEVAVSLKALSTLIAGFGKDVTVTMGAADKVATIAGNRGRFRLPTIPVDSTRTQLKTYSSIFQFSPTSGTIPGRARRTLLI